MASPPYLEKLGIKPADLQASPASAEVPLIADYIPLVEQAVTTGTRRVYSPYWAKVVREWGHMRVNEPTALEISRGIRWIFRLAAPAEPTLAGIVDAPTRCELRSGQVGHDAVVAAAGSGPAGAGAVAAEHLPAQVGGGNHCTASV